MNLIDLIKTCFCLIVLGVVFTFLVVAVIALVFAFVYFIRVFCEWCFDFFFNRRNRSEP